MFLIPISATMFRSVWSLEWTLKICFSQSCLLFVSLLMILMKNLWLCSPAWHDLFSTEPKLTGTGATCCSMWNLIEFHIVSNPGSNKKAYSGCTQGISNILYLFSCWNYLLCLLAELVSKSIAIFWFSQRFFWFQSLVSSVVWCGCTSQGNNLAQEEFCL